MVTKSKFILPCYRLMTLLPNFGRFPYNIAIGAASKQRTLTPLDTWFLSHSGLAFVLMLRPFSSELVMFSDFEYEHPSVLLVSITHGKVLSSPVIFTTNSRSGYLQGYAGLYFWWIMCQYVLIRNVTYCCQYRSKLCKKSRKRNEIVIWRMCSWKCVWIQFTRHLVLFQIGIVIDKWGFMGKTLLEFCVSKR